MENRWFIEHASLSTKNQVTAINDVCSSVNDANGDNNECKSAEFMAAENTLEHEENSIETVCIQRIKYDSLV